MIARDRVIEKGQNLAADERGRARMGKNEGVEQWKCFFLARSASLRADLHPVTRKTRVPGNPGLRR